MYKECQAKLTMVRTILGDSVLDNEVYTCTIIRYIPEKECIYLLTEEAELPDFSLDAEYECVVFGEKETLRCKGFIKERYIGKPGKVIVFRIQKGFYKNHLN